MATVIDSGYILNKGDREAHVRVFAGPGAGKTHFLVQNIRSIVEGDDVIIGSAEKKALCITYTNAAAGEITKRLRGVEKRVSVGTIHSFISENIISVFQENLKDLMFEDFGIRVSTRMKISSQVEGIGILHGVDKEEIYNYIVKESKVKDFPSEYSKKCMGGIQVDIKTFCDSDGESKKQISVGDVPLLHARAIKKYIWSEVRRLTHDEILYFGYRILQTNPFALHALRVKFPYVFVDEFQDTNPLQTRLIKLICEKYSRVILVGDQAQSIYSFQGACPSDFDAFEINGQEIRDFIIANNRRSTASVVNFCNYIRRADKRVRQTSLRTVAGAGPGRIHFIVGDDASARDRIASVVDSGGVVLTRTWAAAFKYARGIDPTQANLLSEIYNSYYNTPIHIRDEIVDKNNVTWIRAFRFILLLHDGFINGSLNVLLNALRLVFKVAKEKLSVKTIRLLDSVVRKVFVEGEDISRVPIVEIISRWNEYINSKEYETLKDVLGEGNLFVSVFDDQEFEKRKIALSKVEWRTAHKLFNEIFAEDSKYMTVHQAKGLEWPVVVVAVWPSRKERADLKSVYSSPDVIGEDVAAEFTRIYYVACSRAKDELYVHLPASSGISRDMVTHAIRSSGFNIEYDFC